VSLHVTTAMGYPSLILVAQTRDASGSFRYAVLCDPQRTHRISPLTLRVAVWLPVTLVADVVTAPVQLFAWLVFRHWSPG
jgi:hypothetical protein